MFNFFDKNIDNAKMLLYNVLNKQEVIIMTLGKIIKDYRQLNKMSQRQFALICKVSNGYISMLEEGKNPKTNEPIVPSIATVKRIASAMGLSLTELMLKVDNMEISIEEETVRKKKNAPSEKLTEGEMKWLELYRRISPESREMLITTLEGLDRLSPEKQKLAAELLRVAIGQK